MTYQEEVAGDCKQFLTTITDYALSPDGEGMGQYVYPLLTSLETFAEQRVTSLETLYDQMGREYKDRQRRREVRLALTAWREVKAFALIQQMGVQVNLSPERGDEEEEEG